MHESLHAVCDHFSVAGVLISSNSQPVLSHNRIFGGKAAGIEVTNGGGGVIKDNEVFDNDFDGICLATGVSPFLSGKYKYRSVGLFMGSCFSLALNVNDSLPSSLSFSCSGNREYNNRQTLDEAVQRGKCLYSISGDNSFPMHDFYR